MVVMKKRMLTSIICIFVLTNCLGFTLMAQADSTNITGLTEPTRDQEEWMKKNFPTVKKISLNELALDRINMEREAKGLRKYTASELGIVPMGTEMEFGAEAGSTQTSLPDGALPGSVDNSDTIYFPPIRSQGAIGSCVAWATTYYQFTYENNLARVRTANTGDNNMIFSPKWTYNMINGGQDQGAYFSDAFNLLAKHGAVTWTEFPYDSNYRAWCLNTAAWRTALNYRYQSWGQIYNPDTSQVITELKTQLTNGHVIVIGTYVTSWVQALVSNDPSTTLDETYNGQKIASYMNRNRQGGHGMTLVGYNDYIWCDLNGNQLVDTGEKGAFKIANSWGTSDWNLGYRWVTYDSLYGASQVPSYGTWPTNDRDPSGIFRGGDMYTVTVRPTYTPQMVAEFTLNHAKRGQLLVSLGIGATTTTTPSTKWYPKALYYTGGAYSFSGTTTGVDGTFVLDFTDITPSTSGEKRWFLGLYDSTSGDPATLKSYKLYQVDGAGDQLVGTYASLPQTVDASQGYYWVDYTLNTLNQAPIAVATATPANANIGVTITFNGTGSSDPDGSIASCSWAFGDGSTAVGATVYHTYASGGTYTAVLTVTDDKGATGQDSVTVTINDPNYINPPTNLVAKASGRTVTLSWTDNSNNETGFEIYRAMKVKGLVTWGYIATAAKDAKTATDTVPGSGTYIYRVTAVNAPYTSAYSNQATVRVK